jgi:hypothetical protein
VIGTELLEELVQTVSVSYKLQNSKPISLILIGDPECGKTTVSEAAGTHGIIRISVTTGIGIVRELSRSKGTNVIILNDLSVIKALNSRAATMLIEVLNGFCEEGLGAIAMPRGKKIDLRNRRGVLIACITTDSFRRSRRDWFSYGFLSRCIPFCYSYPPDLVVKIKNGIDSEDTKTLTGPIGPKDIVPNGVTVPARITEQVRRIADNRAIALEEKGIRLLKLYRTLVKAHALLKGRALVNDLDIRFLYRIDQYVNYQNPRPLGTEVSLL